MELLDGLFLFGVIVFSVIVHEVMHGVAAEWLGDKTARYAGRLTLNPIPHIDPVGSVLLPLIFTLTNSPIFFGWAKPVPYNPYNLRFPKWGEAIVALAGPLSNLGIAVFCALLLKLNLFLGLTPLLLMAVSVNVMLFLFNLIPVPPLDGSKIIPPFLPMALSIRWEKWRGALESNPFLGFGIVILFVILFGDVFAQVVHAVAKFLI